MTETLSSLQNQFLHQLGSEHPEIDPKELDFLLKAAAAAPERPDSDQIYDHILPKRSDTLDQLLKTLKAAYAQDISRAVLSPASSSDRLQMLRAELKNQNVDGFIVPLNDEFHGEAAPASSERLKWLTGFTGSAGVAAVGMTTAAIFIDGRYTLQVRNEVDTSLFTPRHVSDEPLADWIIDTLGPGGRLAYDPWLHTESAITSLLAKLTKHNIKLTPLTPNPIDTVWRDRPPQPLAMVVPHSEKYAGKSSRQKRADIAKRLTENGVDACIHTLPDVTAWLLNIRGADLPSTPFALGFATLHQDETVDLFISKQKLSPDLVQHLGNGVRLHDPADYSVHLKSLKDRTVQIDPATTSQWIADQLSVAGAKIVRAPDPCLLPKATKNEVEAEGTRNAHIRDGVAVSKFLQWLSVETPKKSIDELGAERQLYEFRAVGENFKDTSFSTISGAGPNGAIVHYRSTEESNRVLDQNSFFLVDSGAQYLDGTTDITRTIAIGTPTKEMKTRFTYVLKGHIALARARFPVGTSGSQLDTLARQPLWQLGLDYDHGTGHGVGSYLSVHEGPQRISKMPSSIALQPGMILSNEPGYYKTGEYGIRIENLVIVKEIPAPEGAERDLLGFETLTFAPIDRNAIDPDVLTPDEKEWINQYHQQVWEKISPLLEGDVKNWLKKATAPL